MKILIAASNMTHINNFHVSYIEKFKQEGHEVYTLAKGEEADFNIPFEKNVLSFGNLFLIPKIKKILKEEKFDVVYTHTTLGAFFVRLALKGM
ncbi:MAG: glycosyl transferase family 1, partial [Clostridia bacterium]|nr:glycosyl transferase family 1 [Clostridia bacterium]